VTETCCGFPMAFREFSGVRRYQCTYRLHHPAVWVRLDTGERKTDDDLPVTEVFSDPSTAYS
jgi:hypothetical protein